uniref:Uncharacterized protein n=1 Tax=Ciona savignyi TaxID=51511 RepID=H2Y4C1_CIOSA
MNVPVPVQSPKLKKYQKIMLGLSITEIVLGVISILLGIVVLSLNGYSYHSMPFNSNGAAAEGIWCGIWTSVAGILGIVASRTSRQPCVINCHMGLAITAAVFATYQVFASSVLAIYYQTSVQISLAILIALVGFSALIICIVSACYCCTLYMALTGGPCCCAKGCCGDEIMTQTVGQNVVYVQQPNNQMPYYPIAQQPQTVVQGPDGQQYATTAYQPAAGMVVQNSKTSAVPQENATFPPQQTVVDGSGYANAAEQKQAESTALNP